MEWLNHYFSQTNYYKCIKELEGKCGKNFYKVRDYYHIQANNKFYI